MQGQNASETPHEELAPRASRVAGDPGDQALRPEKSGVEREAVASSHGSPLEAQWRCQNIAGQSRFVKTPEGENLQLVNSDQTAQAKAPVTEARSVNDSGE